MKPRITFLGHAGFRIEGSRIIYIDPFRLKEQQPLQADLVLITHPHYDHLSPVDIKKVLRQNAKTQLVLPRSVDEDKNLPAQIYHLQPGEELELDGVKIRGIPAYNITTKFHQKESNWLGYLFTLDDVIFYHTGDTELVPEMEKVKADVVFVPVGGTYTFDAQSAAEFVSMINPRIAIPMHYGTIVGSLNDALQFKRYATCYVEILQEGKTWTLKFG